MLFKWDAMNMCCDPHMGWLHTDTLIVEENFDYKIDSDHKLHRHMYAIRIITV
jgi:hypothetical protein